MNREDVAMDVTVQNVEILRGRLEQAELALQAIAYLPIAEQDDIPAANMRIIAKQFLASQQVEIVPGHGEHLLQSWRNGQIQGEPHVLDFCPPKHPEQAEGAQGEREACAECSGSGKVYDVSGNGPWSCYACANTSEVVGYANGDELDNMLDDRTAVLSPVKTGFHTVPVYRQARAALAKPSQAPELVHCACGDAFPVNSYGAGFMDANNGVCQNCDAATVAQAGQVPEVFAVELNGKLVEVRISQSQAQEWADAWNASYPNDAQVIGFARIAAAPAQGE